MKERTIHLLPDLRIFVYVVTLIGLLTSGAFTIDEIIEDETCLDCHDGLDQTLDFTKHRLTSELPAAEVTVACVNCHSGAAVHIDEPEVSNIGNPARQLASEAESICTSCHMPHLESGMAGLDPHLGKDISCVSCHSVHGGQAGLLIDTEGGFCGDCHVSVVSQFRLRSNHPLTDQAVSCMSCHNMTGAANPHFGHGSNATCYQCHPEQSGPFMFEHEPVSSFATQGEGCISCHKPHGSSNDRLLTQPGDPVCLQCHGTPPNHRLKHNGLGTQFDCVECHSGMHGSYDNRAFLDPQLGIKISGGPEACFCHGIGN